MNPWTSVRALAGAALAAGALTAMTPGVALAHGARCDATITESTRLQRDLLRCPGVGLVIGADGITLDLNGHTIAGDPGITEPVADGIDNEAGHDRVVVKNGTVRGFGAGVVVVGATGNQFRHLRLTANEFEGLELFFSDDSRIEKNLAAGNGVDTDYSGIILYQSHRNEISGNSLLPTASRESFSRRPATTRSNTTRSSATRQARRRTARTATSSVTTAFSTTATG